MPAHTHATPRAHDHRGHAHVHGHSHVHSHGHDHGQPSRMTSAMLMSAPARLAVAAGLVAALWGLVALAII